MRPNDLVLRGYIERDSDGSWFAICLELNLYARAGSAGEAREKLVKFIHDYVFSAVTKDKEHLRDLIPRRAPLPFWLKYYCYRLAFWCGKHLKKVLFVEPLPVVPAPA